MTVPPISRWRRLSRASRMLAAAAVTLGLLAAGDHAPPPGPAAGDPGPAIASPAEVRRLLLDSWVFDGTRGHFTEAARSVQQSPFSLYETVWRLKLAHATGGGRAGLDPAAVRRWADAALEGRLRRSGLPAIAQLDYAVALVRLLGEQPDRAVVTRTLDRLRDGGGYRADDSAARPDLGSTALAVGVLERLHLPVPRQVVQDIAAVLARPRGRNEGGDRAASAVMSAQLSARLTEASSPARTAALVHAADTALERLAPRADAVWLAQKAALREAAGEAGRAVAPVSRAVCDRLVGSDGGVRLPSSPAPDPQATFHAVELGCRRAGPATVTAHSRAGWPAPQSVSEILSASVSGLRAARYAHSEREFAGPLSRCLLDNALPELVREGQSRSGGAVDRVNLKILAGLLGPGVARKAERALPAPPLDGTDDFSLLLGLTELAVAPSPPAARTAEARAAVEAALARTAPGNRPSVVRAAWLSLAAAVIDDRAAHRAAAAELRALRIGPGVYAAQAIGPGPPTRRDASLTASAIGTRLLPDAAGPRRRWVSAGLCARRRCAETPALLRSLDHQPLRSLALLVSARTDAREPWVITL
ncbi:hypothetical protein [Wenjunlia tyrosinilytica]|uniref:Secreted protein n=1 Tax=Wenjunlia tyrosinilytica TaxID=1544741 RepID=A0A917ZU18_9ACTN|nr:hypothetical protein [Wenjunlia tyrosinilytica]GGO92078.1 hypothetical protein GCM10012280_41440 [Wenjunlia tyrosinilytica]